MAKGKKKSEVDKTINDMVEKYRDKLKEIFAKDTFNLTFDEREKLIDGKIDKARCEILEKHLEKDPGNKCKPNYSPDETEICLCGNPATLCRDDNGNRKIFEREIKTKNGLVKVTEYGYFCSKCRKVFFP